MKRHSGRRYIRVCVLDDIGLLFLPPGWASELLLPLGYLWEQAPLRRKLSHWSPLEELGQASLFVYWIHVEMVYGFFSRPIRRALSLEGALAAYALFTVFLLGLVRLKNWITEGRAIYLTDSKSVI